MSARPPRLKLKSAAGCGPSPGSRRDGRIEDLDDGPADSSPQRHPLDGEQITHAPALDDHRSALVRLVQDVSQALSSLGDGIALHMYIVHELTAALPPA